MLMQQNKSQRDHQHLIVKGQNVRTTGYGSQSLVTSTSHQLRRRELPKRIVFTFQPLLRIKDKSENRPGRGRGRNSIKRSSCWKRAQNCSASKLERARGRRMSSDPTMPLREVQELKNMFKSSSFVMLPSLGPQDTKL